MKKMILAVSLSVVMLLCGCFPFMTSQGSYNPVPNSELSKNIISKMQNNIKTHSIEGFTGQSTFADVLAKTDVKKIKGANLAYKSELLGYPAVMQCSFGIYEDKLLLEDLSFNITGGAEGTNSLDEEKLLAILDAELGKHKKYAEEAGYSDEAGYTDYTWGKDGWRADMSFYEDDNELGNEANIFVYSPVVFMGNLPRIPDIFPYQFGTDINTVYQNEKPGALPEEYYEDCSIDYEDGGIEVNLDFKTDEAGAIKLSSGRYNINLNNMDIKSSLDYFESLAGGLEAAAGKPGSRGYGIPDVEEDFFGISSISRVGTGGGEGLTAQDILDSKTKYYWFEMNWPGIDFIADYGMGVDMSLYFSEEYFGGTENELKQ